MSKKRIKQLKFIANIFQMSLKEIEETLGFETLTMIFRRVGESSGEHLAKAYKGKYSTIEEFTDLIIKHVIEPILGPEQARFITNHNKISIELDACPYKKSGGFPIQKMEFFCHYTEGLFDIALKTAFPDKELLIEPVELIANGCDKCRFEAQW